MPLDPRIPMSGRPVPFNNPFSALQAIQEGNAQRQQQQREDADRAERRRMEQQRLGMEQTRFGQEQEAFEAEKRQQFTKDQILTAAKGAVQKIKGGNAEEVLSLLDPQARQVAEGYLSDISKMREERAGRDAAAIRRTADYIAVNNYDPVTAATSIELLSELIPGAKSELDHIDDPAKFKSRIDQYRTFGQAPTAPVNVPRGGKLVNPTTGAQIADNPIPEAPKSLDQQIAAAVAKGDQAELKRLIGVKRMEADATRAPQQPQTPGPLETIIGPNGKPIRVPREQAIGKETVAGQEKPSSGVQKRVLNFFNRAQQADEELEKLEDQLQSTGVAGQTWMKYAPNFVQTQTGQSYNAAQRAFTEARLRKDSGAAIPPQEFENDRRTYFAQPGDTKETLEQKRRARAAMLASLGFESGQALGEFVGNPDEAKAIVDSYKARAAGTAPNTATKSGGIKILKIEQVP